MSIESRDMDPDADDERARNMRLRCAIAAAAWQCGPVTRDRVAEIMGITPPAYPADIDDHDSSAEGE